MTDPQWTTQMVRELFAVLYGGHRDADGRWHPDTREAARRRRVSQRTIQRWLHGDDHAPAAIPATHLAAILRRRRVRRADLRREELQRARQDKMLQRAGLGRGRGNLKADYADRGWLDKHIVLILEDQHRPLRRVAVVRDDATTRKRTERGARLIDIIYADNKFLAERTRYQILADVEPWRLRLPPTHVKQGHTQVWLASAPLPHLPVHVGR